MPSIPRQDYELAIARTEEAIGRCEQSITRRLSLIETLAADRRATVRELLRTMEEHVDELFARRRQLLEVYRLSSKDTY